jgi:hypothetical protein
VKGRSIAMLKYGPARQRFTLAAASEMADLAVSRGDGVHHGNLCIVLAF